MLAVAFAAAMPLMADTETVGGYTWMYRINGDTAEIYNNGVSAAISPKPDGSVTIPSTLGGKPVTSIGETAFIGCTNLTSVTIGHGVTSIGEAAFIGCCGLTGVTLPDGVTSIGEAAFMYCSGLTNVTIPDSVKRIGDGAFCNCSGLTNVTIPDSVTSIGDQAFRGCSGLASVTIPGSVVGIGSSVFSGCSGLTNMVLPFVGSQRDNTGSPESLFGWIFGSGAYVGGTLVHQCYERDSETIDCYIPTALRSITITDETRLGFGAFIYCRMLTQIIMPNTVTNIGRSAFNGCSGLTDIVIPNQVSRTGKYAFYGCSGLKSVVIPDNVTNIDSGAFTYCRGLTNVTIPDSVTSIGDCAFRWCVGLTYVNIPSGMTNIAATAFVDCSNLQSFTVSEDNPVYKSVSGLLMSKDGRTLVAVPGGLTQVSIPVGVERIEKEALTHSARLTDVTIPDTVTDIGVAAFRRCGGLTTLMLPSSVQNISAYAFSFCSNLTSVTIPASVTNIGHGCFSGCGRLERIVFERREMPVGIGMEAFPSGAEVVMEVEEGHEFSRWVDAAGMAVDFASITNTVSVWPRWKLMLRVEDVSFRQRYPWNGLVDIDCNVNCARSDVDFSLSVDAKEEALGRNLTVRHVWLENDATHTNALTVKAGRHRLVWDAGADNPGVVANAVKVEVGAALETGRYLVVDLSGGPNAVSYPISWLDAEPQGGWTDEYKTTKLVLRRIPAGTFTMGSPTDEIGHEADETLHVVTISQPFYMGVFEVTQKQYELVTGGNPSRNKGDARPVECVSWDIIRGNSLVYDWPAAYQADGATFVGKLRAKTGILTFDLPTEAKWEYACRAGTATALNNGKNLTNAEQDPVMDEVGRYYHNSGAGGASDGKGGYDQHTTVGSYMPNAWGLYDMHGNVWEWCLDRYARYEKGPITDPIGPISDANRVRRGGCWNGITTNGVLVQVSADVCRSANRGSTPSWYSNYDIIGFRICCSAGLQ